MKKKPVICTHCRTTFLAPDGVVKMLPVDQFPLKEFNVNRFGWPKSDVTILDELSKSTSIDLSLFNAFASRINVLKAEPKNNKSVEELIHDFRPSWIQTVSEEMDYVKWFNEVYSSTSAQAKNEEIEKVASVETKSE